MTAKDPGPRSTEPADAHASDKAHHDKAGKPKTGWLARLRPGLKAQAAPRVQETPDDLWMKDPETGELLYRPDLEASLWVTPSGHHLRITPDQRFAVTFDGGEHERIKAPTAPVDRSASRTRNPTPNA
jgi:acetyl-CoA carboxylase carboxyl transferase subunit beta